MKSNKRSQKHLDGSYNFSSRERRFFKLSCLLQKSSAISEITYMILKVIQYIEILALSRKIQFQSDPDIYYDNISFFLQYFNLDVIIQKSSTTLDENPYLDQTILTYLGIALGIEATVIIIFFISYCLTSLTNNKQTRLAGIMAKAINYMLWLIKTILMLPIVMLIIDGFIYSFKYSSGQSTIVAILLSVITLLLHLILQFGIAIVHPLASPFIKHPEACQVLLKYFFIMGVVTILAILESLTFLNINLAIPFFVVITVIWLLKITEFKIIYGYTSSKNNLSTRAEKIISFFCFLYGLFLLIRTLVTPEQWNQGFYIFFIILFCMMVIFVILKEKVRVQELAQIIPGNYDIAHFYKLIATIEELSAVKTSFRSRLIYEGFLFFHLRHCREPDSHCICEDLPSRKFLSNHQCKLIYYIFLSGFLKKSINKLEDPQEEYILLAQIYQERLKNRFQAVYYYTKALNYYPSFFMKMKFFQRIQSIQEVMEQDDIKNLHKYQNSSININKFLEFSLQLTKFELTLAESSNNHILFWKQLLENKVSLEELNRQGSLITKQKEEIQKQFQKLTEMNSQNVLLMKMYADFLFLICSDSENTEVIREKANFLEIRNKVQVGKSVIQNKYSFNNTTTGIIIISGNQSSLGKLVQVNKPIAQFTGYQRSQLLNSSVNSLMPKFFSEHHDLVLNRFLSTSNERLNNKERIVPLLDSNRYIIPILALTKALPDLSQGIRIVGFICQLSNFQDFQEETMKHQTQMRNFEFEGSDAAYILYQCNTETVLGISKNAEEFGIPRCLVYGDKENTGNMNQLKMKNILGVNIQKVQEGGIASEQLILNLDTTKLENQFIIVNNVTTEKNITRNKQGTSQLAQTPNWYERRGKTIRVLAKSILSITYFSMPARLIRLVQFSGDGNVTHDLKQYQQDESRKSVFGERGNRLKTNENQEEKSNSDNNALKEFKSFTGIKKQSSNIRIINWICNSLIFFLLASTCIFIWTWSVKTSLNNQVAAALEVSFENRIYLSEILFQIEKLYIQTNDRFSNSTTAFNVSQITEKLKFLWSLSEKNSLLLLTYKNTHKIQKQKIADYILKVDGVEGEGINNFVVKQLELDYSIMSWLSKARDILTGKFEYLKPEPLNFHSLMVNNYLQNKYTGIFSILSANIRVQDEIITSYSQNLQMNKIIQYLIMGIVGVMLFILVILSGPRTLKVININHKVLSLFRMISKMAVAQIIQRCFCFQKQYNQSLDLENSALYRFITQMKNTSKQKMGNQIESPSMHRRMESSSGMILVPNSTGWGDERKLKSTFGINELKNISGQESVFKGWKKKSIILYTLIVFFALSHNIFNFLIGTLFASEHHKDLLRTEMLFQRAVHFPEFKLTFTEYLLDPTLSTQAQTIQQLNEFLVEHIYENENKIVDNIQKIEAQSNYLAYDSANICSICSEYKSKAVYQPEISTFSQQECQSIDQGLLQKGVQNILVHELERIRAVLAGHFTLIIQPEIQRMEQVNKYTVAALWQRASKSKEAMAQRQENMSILFFIINGVLVIIYLIFWRVIWKIFTNQLNESIWNTKGMLNIIPPKIIQKDSMLMHYICSGQFEKAVS